MIRILLASVLILLAPASASAETVYTVCHKGDRLGSHIVSERKEGERRVVETVVDLSVFFGAWSFESRQEEIWEGERLIAFTSTTDDDGEWHEIAAVPAGEGLLMKGHHHETPLPADAAPENFHHAFIRDRTTVFETKKGWPRRIAVAAVGRDAIRIDGRLTPANRYAVMGDLTRMLWYDDEDRLLRIAFLNKGRPFVITRGGC